MPFRLLLKVNRGSFRVEGFTLFSSHLGKGDPHYRPEADYLFEAPIV